MSRTNIYVLRLEGGKYYVGKSDNVQHRFEQHLVGDGSAWTRKYKPVKLETVIKDVSVFEEDKITKEYMAKYGIDNVRGGSYVAMRLDDEEKDIIQKEIWAATDKCTVCGSAGHFAKDCDEDDEEEVVWECEHCGKWFESEKGCELHERACMRRGGGAAGYSGKSSSKPSGITCFRCGHVGHYASGCYARYDVDGNGLDSDSEYDSD